MKKNALELLTLITMLSTTSCNMNRLVDREISLYSPNESTSSSHKESSSNESSSSQSIEESSSVSESTSSSEVSSSSSVGEHDHVYADPTDYMSLQECSICHEYGRVEPTNEFLGIFKDEYTDGDKTSVEILIQECEDYVTESKKTTDENGLETISDILDTKLSELYALANDIGDSYTYAELMSYYTNTEYWNDRYEEIYATYQLAITNYNVIQNHIFYSPLKEIFFEGEDFEALEKELAPYEDDTLATLSAEIKELENEAYFEHVNSDYLFFQDVYNLISKRNQLADLMGYDNYYDYAYENEYDRKYGSDSINLYRQYVKDYIIPTYFIVAESFYGENYYFNVSTADKYFLDPCFDDKDAMNIMTNYYKTMTSEKYGISMYDTINNAFKEGRVFIGDGKDVAFTNNLSYDGNLMLFKNDYYYAGSGAFAHESGHFMIDYMEMPCNDYDLMETHSQSNEALHLNYLQTILSTEEFNALELYYISDVFATVITTCMIDEIEECLYKNYCSYEESLKDGISKSEYNQLVSAVLNSYGLSGGADNWKYYFTQSSCYEVSYGISVLPCCGLYLTAKTDLAKAKANYFTAMNFYKDEEFLNNYDINDFSYLDVLEYAGYMNSFDEDLYQLIANSVQ